MSSGVGWCDAGRLEELSHGAVALVRLPDPGGPPPPVTSSALSQRGGTGGEALAAQFAKITTDGQPRGGAGGCSRGGGRGRGRGGPRS